MVFKIYTFSSIGLNQVGSFYNHTHAFNYALEIESAFHLTYIVERQWCVKVNMVVNKNYCIKDGSIYNTNDMNIPIYTNKAEYSKYTNYRMFVKTLIYNIQDIFDYMKVRCHYTDEYLYSYTFAELKQLESDMMKDSIVNDFYKEARIYFNAIIDIINLYKLPATKFIDDIVRQKPSVMIETFKLAQKEVKNYMLKTVYGASLIDMYPL